ncbi:hypothetical protein GPA10_12380 [Streptomyces sp. p1417]|uniref:Uncharacterized protein n=1 Tax=Streptomyces typhae TaxID=2681492 RepID=A0A6L6WUZ8_9ACTN|nr:hypothetical protein [Streptomyces typhae]MVO85527.1 hypothetical protein [Streptomyces typhae]
MTVSALVGAAATLLAVLSLRHHKQVWAWMKRVRRTDEDTKDLDDAAAYLRELFEKQCEYAQKPCGAAEFAPLRRLLNLLSATAEETEMISHELHGVVERLERYLNTELHTAAGTAKASAASRTLQLEKAMKQEHARIELKTAISAAQQKIRTLRRAV